MTKGFGSSPAASNPTAGGGNGGGGIPAGISLSPHLLHRALLGTLGFAALTYLLFQKKLLPKPVSRVVARAFFLPTFPITALLRVGNYWTKVDDTLYLGCAPMALLGHPEQLYHDLGVRGVVNMCDEYSGPKASYEKLGIKQLHLPTVDHFEPSLDQMQTAVAFIQEHADRGQKVYVHCKAGHGRGGSIGLCWMVHRNPKSSVKQLNELLREKRKVRSKLYLQKNMIAFKESLLSSQHNQQGQS